MHVAISVLLLLFVTTLSSLLSRVIRLPLPLLQIALGVGLNLLGAHVHLDPGVFMLLFIPPLLFSDAYLMPMREFRALWRIILMMALGLVLFTTLACGAFIHWLIPPVPLAAAFALAAVLSPTDAVAVAGMVEGRPVPHRFLHILSGEALLNDASGLVCFKFAAAAALTGTFSAGAAGLSFLLVSLAGLAVGAVLAGLLALVERLLTRQGFDDPATYVTVSALLPFAAYLAAEHLHASGILAAVAAGLTLKQARIFDGTAGQTRLRISAVWGVLTFGFNGLIFLLLGLQLPDLVRSGLRLEQAAHLPWWKMPVTVVLITATLAALRLAWVTLSLLLRFGVRHLRAARSVGAVPRPTQLTPSVPLVLAMSLAGVRGAITLAAVLSLAPGFPERDLLVTLAAGVIVASLVLAAIGLPLLLRGAAPAGADPMQREADLARLAIARVSVEAVERELAAPVAPDAGARERDDVLAHLLQRYQARQQQLAAALDPAAAGAEPAPTLRRDLLETAFRLRVLRMERAALLRMTRSFEINDQTERLLARELDHEEEVLAATARALRRAGNGIERGGDAGLGAGGMLA